MSEVLPAAEAIDLAFPLQGEAVAPDYAAALLAALRERLPWLDAEPRAGVHPLKGVSASGGRLFLSRRAQLILRLPRTRVAAAMTIEGAVLEVAGARLQAGRGSLRELAPYPVLYSHFVATGADAEDAFLAAARQLATGAGIECKLIVGKRRVATAGEECISGYSLMLHGLTAADSLRMQASGLGDHRQLGCGIFIPHKSIAAVGL
jgi:CRISPR-associated protein Cas6